MDTPATMTADASFARDVAGVLPQGRIEAMAAIGLDFLEGKRAGAHVYDQQGTRYLDAISGAGTFNLGRRHPELAEELKRAMRETDQGNFPMISKEKALLAKALADFTPRSSSLQPSASGLQPLECSVFSVMRGEAMEFACKVARGFTGRRRLVAGDGGWYGQTGFALSLSQRPDRDLYGPLIPETRTIPFGDLDAAENAISDLTAAMILEPIQAENHCREASREYLEAVARLCRTAGALLVIDETQTGFGRTGTKFAFERAGIAPDVLVLGEALGGGLFPIATTLITRRVNAFMNAHPLIHLSTFGGSDIGCRVAIKALELYEREKPWGNAAAMGERLVKGVQTIMQMPQSPIRGVAGRGLLVSVDLGDENRAQAFCRSARKHGLLVMPGEVARNTVVLRPSLLICEAELNEILGAVRAAALAC